MNEYPVELKYIDQKNEGLEAWIRSGSSGWIRLDFMLEYYLFGNVNLTIEYKGKLDDHSVAREYSHLLYNKFLGETSNGENFDFEKYLMWQKENSSKISDLAKLINRHL